MPAAPSPSLLEFQPKRYSGGVSRFHLPLLHDLVLRTAPRLVVVLGLGDGQLGCAICQTIREGRLATRCIALRQVWGSMGEADDAQWREGRNYGAEFYGDFAEFLADSPLEPAEAIDDGSVDLLLIDDCVSGDAIREQITRWEAKLSPRGILLLHGINLERANGPRQAWQAFAAEAHAEEFPAGIGMGMIEREEAGTRFSGEVQRALYAAHAARIEATARATEAIRRSKVFEARQVWLDSVLSDRWKAQQVMDHQGRVIADLQARFDALQADREKAQEIMDHQRRAIETLERQLEKRKSVPSSAKPKPKLSLGRKVSRELIRLGRQLRLLPGRHE